jgi:hypothetical protein
VVASGSAVKAVQVVIYKHVGKGLCKPVKANGKLSRSVRCAGAPFATLAAAGTSKWSLRLTGKLAKSTYVTYVRAIDSAGNVQALGKRLTLKVR